MKSRHIVAIDLGASSGRVMLARYQTSSSCLTLSEIHRFPNRLSTEHQHDCWDLAEIEAQILIGLTKLTELGITPDSIGIDTWGVDYVLLDKSGQRIGSAYSYRDHRTDGVMTEVVNQLDAEYIYQKTGIQFLPFNTLYQLKALMQSPDIPLDHVTDLLMIPDYLAYRLTGKINCEYTNATTTQLINLATGDWDQELLDYLQIPHHWFKPIRQPGNVIGYWHDPQHNPIPVIAVASHDTASAVISTPLHNDNCAYLSSGTWSLMGLNRREVYISPLSLSMNITHEGGIEGYYRILKNIMGLWLFQRLCQEHQISDITALLTAAEHYPAFVSLINPNDLCFLNPPSMTEAIRAACQQHQQPIPQTVAALTRCIIDSLSLLYGHVFEQLSQLQGAPIEQLYIVGGGSQNQLLNQLCADVCRCVVSAGPIEASTLGNVGCQLMALGEITTMKDFHPLIRHNFPLMQYQPQPLNLEQIWPRFNAILTADAD